MTGFKFFRICFVSYLFWLKARTTQLFGLLLELQYIYLTTNHVPLPHPLAWHLLSHASLRYGLHHPHISTYTRRASGQPHVVDVTFRLWPLESCLSHNANHPFLRLLLPLLTHLPPSCLFILTLIYINVYFSKEQWLALQNVHKGILFSLWTTVFLFFF